MKRSQIYRKGIVFFLTLVFIITIAAPGLSAASPFYSGQTYYGDNVSAYTDEAPPDLPQYTEPHEFNPYDLSGRVIILDPGHGIGSTNIFMGYDEQVAMLDLALRIKPLLEKSGAQVLLTRETGANVLLSVRAAMTNIWALEALEQTRLRSAMESEYADELFDGDVIICEKLLNDINEIHELISIMQSIIDDPIEYSSIFMNTPFDPQRPIHPDLQRILELQNDPEIYTRFLFISLHSNATPRPINTAMNGAMTFHISNEHKNTRNYFTGFSHEALSRSFGNFLLGHIEEVGFRNLGPRRDNFFVIREHNLPAVLAENGFHTNARDRAMLMSESYMDRLAQAYFNAITDYFAALPLHGSHHDPYDIPFGSEYDSDQNDSIEEIYYSDGNAH